MTAARSAKRPINDVSPPRGTGVVVSGVMMMLIATACLASDETSALRSPEGCASLRAGMTKVAFGAAPIAPSVGAGALRVGWMDREPSLSAERIARGGMVSSWTSAPFDSIVREETTYIGRTYASPLYADGVRIASRVGGAASGEALSVVFTATSNGDVYAIAAFDAMCAGGATLTAGSILWHARIANARIVPSLDGHPKAPNPGSITKGIAIGTLATPVLDFRSDTGTGTLYVTAMDAASNENASPTSLPVWKAYAIDITTGMVEPGWPVVLSRDAIEPTNTNGPAYFDEDARYAAQRSALALSPQRDRLYVAFGGFYDQAIGWIVAIDTGRAANASPRIVASFSSAPDLEIVNGERVRHNNGGMWGPGGPSIDDRGRVYVTTGASQVTDAANPRAWGNSMLRLDRDLELDAAYSPYDHCTLDATNGDLAASSVTLLPAIDGAKTPHLAAFGGKAGVVYLVDRDALPSITATGRTACATSWEDAARDESLLPLAPAEPYCDGFPPDITRTDAFCVEPRPSTRCVRGPLQVFGPGREMVGLDNAKMRTMPAFFRDESGASFLYVAGSTKDTRCDVRVKPPSLVRLRVVSAPGERSSLAIDATDDELRFQNPGSPVVTSHGGNGPIVWVIDQGALRSHPLLAPDTPAPTLYAIDGRTMKLLWRSSPTDLEPGGKYVTPLIAHGTVFVATDRLHAFTSAPP